MNQSKLGSLIEALANIAIGSGVALASQLMIFPLFGIFVSLQTNLWITVWFTGVSVVRSYVVRRWFNARLQQMSRAIAGGLS